MIKSLYPCFQHWSKNGGVYLVSDTHFKDLDRKYMGYHISNEDQWYIINDTCHKNDTLIHLGDVGDLEYIKRLKCYKVLIMGNHDQGKEKFQKKIEIIDLDGYSEKEREEMEQEGFIDFWSYDFTKPFIKGYKSNNLFDEVYSGPLWISQKLVLSHEPIVIEDPHFSMPIAFNIHGHDHGKNFWDDEYHLNICQNVYGYIPLNLNQFIKGGHLKRVKDIHTLAKENAIAEKETREILHEWYTDTGVENV